MPGSSKGPPHDSTAEAAVIGEMLSFPETVPDLAGVLDPSDFYNPSYGACFEILVKAHAEGRTLDAHAMNVELEKQDRGLHTVQLADLLAAATGAYMAHAQVIIEHRQRRDALALVSEAQAALVQPGQAPDETIAALRSRLDQIETPLGQLPANCLRVDEFLATADDDTFDEWVLPGLLRRGWRCIIVAGEGAGKSIMFRQMAVTAAHGIHPFHFQPLDADVRVLLVDCENPAGTLRRSIRGLTRRVPDPRPDNLTIWSQPRGMNVLSRQGRRQLEAAIDHASPALLLIGPLYKTYRRERGQDDEYAAGDAQAIFDDLRDRYGFALVIEHHAPHGYNGSRDMRPFGTSLWLRWPELGYGLQTHVGKDKQPELVRTLWRADRDRASWPERFRRGGEWPWTGIWPDGTFAQQQF